MLIKVLGGAGGAVFCWARGFFGEGNFSKEWRGAFLNNLGVAQRGFFLWGAGGGNRGGGRTEDFYFFGPRGGGLFQWKPISELGGGLGFWGEIFWGVF